MSFQEPLFFPVISWIFLSKKAHFVFLTTFLKILQFLISFETLYLSRAFWQSSFHHNFKCLVILTIFKCLNQICLVLSVNSCTIPSRTSLLEICSLSGLLIEFLSSARKFDSSTLFLTIICFLVWIYSSIIAISTVSGAWFNDNLYSGHITWLSNSDEVSHKNIRTMTKLELLELSEYLVGTWLVDLEIHRFIESAISVRIFQ